MIRCSKEKTLQLHCGAPATVIMHFLYLHCLTQLHRLEPDIQFFG